MALNLVVHFRSYLISLHNFFKSIVIAIISISILIFGLFSGKAKVPSTIVFSLTREQVLEDKNLHNLLNCLKEERFHNYFRVCNLLIEVRSIKSLLVCDKFITIDAPFYLLTRCVKKSHYSAFFMKVCRSVFVIRGRELLGLKDMKRLVFDSAVYEIFHEYMYPKIDLVTTNSSLHKLPFAFECPVKGRTVMLWYSTNSKPFKFREKLQSLVWDVDPIKAKIDLHLVWTKSDVKFLESLDIHDAYAIGPILFQPQIMAKKNIETYVITFFDIIPFTPGTAQISTTQENFYSEQNALDDLECIEKLNRLLLDAFGERIKVRIKPKRAYSSRHSKNYRSRVREYTLEQQIELLGHNVNLYEVVSESDLVLATPWTSPAVLAKEMSINSAFFTIRGTDWDLPDEYEGISVIKSLSGLWEYVNRDIQEKLIN